MGFPEDAFVPNDLVDKTDGSTPDQFFDAENAANWDDTIEEMSDNMRLGAYRVVQNDTGSILEKGKPVRISGHDGTNPEVELAQADSTDNFADGIVFADIGIGSTGIIVQRFGMSGLDTSAFIAQDEVFLDASVAGDLTDTAPALRQRLGRVTVVDASTGEIEFDVDRDAGEQSDDLFEERAHLLTNTGKTSDTALSAALTISLPANTALYHFRAYIKNSQTGAIADLKIRMDYSGALTGLSEYELWDYGTDNSFDPNSNNLRSQALNADVSLNQPTGALAEYCTILEGSFRVNNSAGDLTLQWAQDTSDGNSTTLLQGTYLEVKRAEEQ